jgi:hypothetical protein
MGDKNCEGKHTIEEIVEVVEDTVLIDNADIMEVE